MYQQLSLKENCVSLRSPPADTREGETTFSQIHNSRRSVWNYTQLCFESADGNFISTCTEKWAQNANTAVYSGFALAIFCSLLNVFHLVFILQLSVACMWALTPTWVSTHTPPWRPTSCWELWAWNWTEQKRRWCLPWCQILEVHAEKCLYDTHQQRFSPFLLTIFTLYGRVFLPFCIAALLTSFLPFFFFPYLSL